MENFHRIDTPLAQPAQRAQSGPLFQVGRRRHTSQTADQRGDRFELRKRLGNVCRAVVGEVAIEGLIDRPHLGRVDERPGHVGAPDRAAACVSPNRLHGDPDSQVAQATHDFFGSLDASVPLRDKKSIQLRMVGREKVSQQMELTPPRFDAELAPRDHPHAD